MRADLLSEQTPATQVTEMAWNTATGLVTFAATGDSLNVVFSDYFIEKGHDVQIFTDFGETRIKENYTRYSFLNWFHFKHLGYQHFVWSDLRRIYKTKG